MRKRRRKPVGTIWLSGVVPGPVLLQLQNDGAAAGAHAPPGQPLRPRSRRSTSPTWPGNGQPLAPMLSLALAGAAARGDADTACAVIKNKHARGSTRLQRPIGFGHSMG